MTNRIRWKHECHESSLINCVKFNNKLCDGFTLDFLSPLPNIHLYFISAHSLNLPIHSNENEAIDVAVTTIFIVIPYLIVWDIFANAQYTSSKVKFVEFTKRNLCWFNLVVFRPKASTISVSLYHRDDSQRLFHSYFMWKNHTHRNWNRNKNKHPVR